MSNYDAQVAGLLDDILQNEAALHEIKAARAELDAERRRLDSAVAGKKAALVAIMTENGVTSEMLPNATVSVVQGRGKVVYADDFDLGALDPEYVRIKREPDAEQIKAALKRGEVVPGASLSTGGQSLRIQMKEAV